MAKRRDIIVIGGSAGALEELKNTASALDMALSGAVEDALCASLRTLEEKAALLRRMASGGPRKLRQVTGSKLWATRRMRKRLASC